MDGTCRVCGCTDVNACLDDGTGSACHWVQPDLCSTCTICSGCSENGMRRVLAARNLVMVGVCFCGEVRYADPAAKEAR